MANTKQQKAASVFNNAFTASAVCSPSRTALATGMYQTSIGAYHMRYPDELLPSLPDGIHTVFQVLKENGYVTANIKDKQGSGKNDWMFRHIVIEHFDFESWQDVKDSGKPFVAQVNIRHTHRAFAQAGKSEFADVQIPPYYPDNIVSQTDWANYYKSIEMLDVEVGKVLKKVSELGLHENTIVIFMGDHGRPMTRGKTWLYDSGIKIPLLIYVPEAVFVEGYREGSQNDDLISGIDITATVLNLAGIETPTWMQGQAFLGDDYKSERTFIYSAIDRVGEVNLKSRCVRTKDFKLIRNYHHNFSINEASTAYRKAMHPIYHLIDLYHERGLLNNAQQNLVDDLPFEELYDVRNDPFEINNLIDDPSHAKDVKQLRKLLDKYLTEIDDKAIYTKDSDEIVKAFEAYGLQSRERYGEKYKTMRFQVKTSLQLDNE